MFVLNYFIILCVLKMRAKSWESASACLLRRCVLNVLARLNMRTSLFIPQQETLKGFKIVILL